MVKAKVYVEGGGKGGLNTACRRAFAKFIENAGLTGNVSRVEACGDRGEAFNRFKAHDERDSRAILLVDAESPVTARGPWQHLKGIENWDPPPGATDSQCHLMVQVMESWFLADVSALQSYFGQGFRPQDLPRNPNIEEVRKPDVEQSLSRATRGTTKGAYRKSSHSFEILAQLNSAKVRAASPHAKRFLQVLESGS